MASLGAWLRLVRVHTGSLTMAGAVIGGLLAGGSPGVLALLAGWALLYHAVGFAMNNVADFTADHRDPAKQHFPLVTGELTYGTAERFVKLGVMASFFSGSVLTLAANPPGIALLGSILFLGVAHTAGILYNVTSKRSLWAPVHICLAFASIPGFGYFAAGGQGDPVATLVVLYAAALMAFQISVSGDLKDLRTDPVSRMGRLGARVVRTQQTATFTVSGTASGTVTVPVPVPIGWEETLELPPAARAYAWALRIPTLLLAAIIALWAGSAWLAGLAAAVLGALTVLETHRLLQPGPYDHPRLLKRVSLIEVLVYFTLVFSLQGVVGWGWVGFLLAFPLVWFFSMNRVTWGQWSAPRV